MHDAETVAVLRAVLDELCANLATSDIGTRMHVASKLHETARQGRSAIDDLKGGGKGALKQPPTMWR